MSNKTPATYLYLSVMSYLSVFVSVFSVYLALDWQDVIIGGYIGRLLSVCVCVMERGGRPKSHTKSFNKTLTIWYYMTDP